MSLINHNRAVVLVLKLNNLRQVGQVTLHREHTVNYYKLHSLVWQILEHTLEVFHIVVLVVELCSKGETTAIHNTCVVAVVADDIVATTYYNGKNARVNKETC